MEPDEYYETVELHIRWSDRQDSVFNVPVEETIYAIKQKVRFSFSFLQHTNLFFFYID